MLAEPYVDTMTRQQHSNQSNTTKEKMVDYTNLYIKNLDAKVTSYDLFQKFKDFGKIISARVMKDTQTHVSKGYGFVSFTRMEDASLAMQKMQGERIYSKGIIITFHEPKKTVPKKEGNNYAAFQQPSPPQQPSFPYSYQQPYPCIYPGNQSTSGVYQPHHHRYVPDHNMSFKQPINDVNGWMSTSPPPPPIVSSRSTVAPAPGYAYSSMHPTTTTNNNAFESNHFIVSPTPSIPAPSHYLQRTTSNDSFQRQKLIEAISCHLDKHQIKNDLEDLVDMIQSLKKRDLSLCLFNPTFLKQKIAEAYKALYVFDDNQEQPRTHSVATTPSLHHLDEDDDEVDSITSLLASLQGLSLYKQKKVLGDILFPLVKATGVRRAPKVTIWLLDTIPLEELASIMYDHEELSRMTHYATSQIE